MAEMSQVRKAKPRTDVYTMLLFIALVALVFGVAFTWYRFAEVFGTADILAPLSMGVEALRATASV
ncbi:MAG: hypothetical protein WD009_09205 [Phycisphaeraceae bacterium]